MSRKPSDLITVNTRPTWAEIDLSSLRHNYRTLASHVAPKASICAVVKCDAYGHGALECALSLEAEGAQWFGVTNPSEALVLRKGGIKGRILLLSGFWQGEEDAVLEHDLTPAVWTEGHLQWLDAAAKRAGKNKVPVHLKIDTWHVETGQCAGMNCRRCCRSLPGKASRYRSCLESPCVFRGRRCL